VRDEKGLTAALSELDALSETWPGAAGEARNLLGVARLVTAAALARRESRGGHYRSDFPRPDPEWQRRQFLTAAPDGSAVFEASDASEAPMAVAGAR
jgi:L-aspartate oxidase